MKLIMPFNKAGGRAKAENESHVIGVFEQAHNVFIAEHNSLIAQADRDAVWAKWNIINRAGIEAEQKARRGDAYWLGAIEHAGKTILDYWNGFMVIYPQIINHANASSKFSFLLYLATALSEVEHVMPVTHKDLFDQLYLMKQQILDDKFWIINSITEVVG